MAALHSGRLPELDMGQMLLGQHGGSIGRYLSLCCCWAACT